jgi:hypothetical protein
MQQSVAWKQRKTSVMRYLFLYRINGEREHNKVAYSYDHEQNDAFRGFVSRFIVQHSEEMLTSCSKHYKTFRKKEQSIMDFQQLIDTHDVIISLKLLF